MLTDANGRIVDCLIGAKNLSFWIYKIWHCKEHNFLVPYFSVRYLQILDPQNTPIASVIHQTFPCTANNVRNLIYSPQYKNIHYSLNHVTLFTSEL